MPTQRIAFTEWLPDQPTTTNALLTANNVYPLTIGYGPFPNSADYSTAASENLKLISDYAQNSILNSNGKQIYGES